ncbi:nurim homolog [Anthonomus grandis grandis]|uniref:nurim homolog n=1 Tax=Anthonomus grandis grandis TaxID=2921223 RepID=UPI0021663A84|nr:nurim homolog [Anthonomus grandis grandis]
MLTKLFKIIISLTSFVIAAYSILELTYFLSVPKTLIKKSDSWVDTSQNMLVNMVLLSIFILQHSAMASQKYKNFVKSRVVDDISRSFYVTATAATLLLIIKNWQPTLNLIIWNFDLSYKPLWLLYISIHTGTWMIIYVANICTDIPELVGLKQVYYSLINQPDPMKRKSLQLQRLTSHMRHPSFLGFLLIFWFFPVMTLDRMLLATILSCYMYIAWNTDGEDYTYQKYMFDRKYLELLRLDKAR